MSISFFKTVKSVLDQSISDYCRTTGVAREQALDKLRTFLRENRSAYFSSGGILFRPKAVLQYRDPLCRMAYLYAYVAANANLVDIAFQEFEPLSAVVAERLASGKPLTVCSLGGGPGSELLGLAKYVERLAQGRCLELDFVLLDNVKEWDETWNTLRCDVMDQMAQAYGAAASRPILVSHSFSPLDLTELSDFQNQPSRFANVDVFILNLVISEIIDDPGEFADVVCWLAERSTGDSLFLVIDRNERRVLRAAERILEDACLSRIGKFKRERCMDYDEQKSDLGDWLDQLNWWPKVKLNAFCILAAKDPHLGLGYEVL